MLTPAEEVIDLDRIEVGRHGLIVSHNGCRGLLLPQVATEHGWTREQFLDADLPEGRAAARRVAARRADLLLRGGSVRGAADEEIEISSISISRLTGPSRSASSFAAGRQHDCRDKRRAHLGIAPELKRPADESDVDQPHLVRAIGQDDRSPRRHARELQEHLRGSGALGGRDPGIRLVRHPQTIGRRRARQESAAAARSPPGTAGSAAIATETERSAAPPPAGSVPAESAAVSNGAGCRVRTGAVSHGSATPSARAALRHDRERALMRVGAASVEQRRQGRSTVRAIAARAFGQRRWRPRQRRSAGPRGRCRRSAASRTRTTSR